MREFTPEQVARAQRHAPRLLVHLEKAYRLLVQVHVRVGVTVADDEEMMAMQRAIGDAGGSTE